MVEGSKNIFHFFGRASKTMISSLGQIKSSIDKIICIASWLFSSLPRILSDSRNNDIRLLMIYDLSSQPFSIGDILLFQEASLVLREQFRVDTVDFALVFNPVKPAASDPSFSNITEENCLFNIASILPVAQVNPYLGSLFLFNSHAQLEHFVASNHKRYHFWPPAGCYATKEYMYYHIFNRLLYDYHKKHNSIPTLTSRQNMLSWARLFVEGNVLPSVPVTVQLRRNAINTARNSNYDAWIEFFQYCETRYPARFIIICSKSEIDERFRKLSNVVIAKDFHTDIEQDLALINFSPVHMGASAGPGIIAIFSSKPYLLIKTDVQPLLDTGFTIHGNFMQSFFSGPDQKITICGETTELLRTEFEKLWEAMDKTWLDSPSGQSKTHSINNKLYSWLR